MIQKKSIDVIIIAKNEASRIADCIDRVSWADQIYLIDNDSVDETARIAKAKGATIIKATSENFAELRNIGAQKSTSDWLLYIDADECVTEQLAYEIRSIIQGKPKDSGFILPRKNYYLGYPWPFIDGMVRFIRRDAFKSWTGPLHEHVVINGSIGTLKNYVIHDTHRTLEEMVDKTNRWSLTEAKLRYDSDHPRVVWWRLLRVMVTGFLDSYIRQGGWKAGTVGWIESTFQAFSMFITYAKLWELQQKK